jgi:phosphoglycolate phosphatase
MRAPFSDGARNVHPRPLTGRREGGTQPAMSNYSLVIFDFDGTLADSFPWFIASLDRTADKFGLKKVDPAEIESLRMLSSREALQHLGVPMLKLPQIAIYIHLHARYFR